MCCEMDRAFEEVNSLPWPLPVKRANQQFHSENRSPWGPITMLYTMWHASAELEGYGQQGTIISSRIVLIAQRH